MTYKMFSEEKLSLEGQKKQQSLFCIKRHKIFNVLLITEGFVFQMNIACSTFDLFKGECVG